MTTPEPAAATTITLAEALERLAAEDPQCSVALFQHRSLSVKLYVPRGHDPQTPHSRDEAYVVANGRGVFFDGSSRRRFEPGTFLFAAAGQPHRFEDFSDDLAVWVLFYGPEGGEASHSSTLNAEE